MNQDTRAEWRKNNLNQGDKKDSVLENTCAK
jgi:hypothetical protein